MKKRLVLLLALAGILFAVATIWKRSSTDNLSATEAVSEVERKSVQSFWRLYQEATSTRTSGDFGKAEKLYRKALQLKPDHEDSLYYLGNCLFETGQYREAAEHYRRIIKVNPNSQRALSQLGVTLSIMAPAAPFSPAEAESCFRRSIAINSEESGPFLRLGFLSLNLADSNKALEYFRTAAAFRSPEGYFQAGSVLYSQARYRDAAAMFVEVLRLNAREKAISGRGVLSEGDVLTSGQSLTPLEAAGVKSLLYLAWTAARLGGYPPGVEKEFQLRLSKPPGAAARLSAFDRLMSRSISTAWGDFDQDGDQDLALVLDDGRIELHRNVAGKLVPVPEWVGRDVSSTKVLAWGDFDGDGRLDLFAAGGGMVRPGPSTLLRNTGKEFLEVTDAWGIGGARMTLNVWTGDLDQDGRLDLLEAGCADPEHPSVRFYRNSGGRFQDVSREAGLVVDGNATDCVAEDFNSDGYPDVVVLRWKRPPLLFLARKPGSFEDPTELQSASPAGYSCVTADFNRDSHPDLVITEHADYGLVAQNLVRPDLVSSTQTLRLLLGDGRGGFKDVTSEVGIDRCYGVVQAEVGDVDGDGWPDLMLANGGPEPSRLEPAVILRNEAGKRFRPLAYLPDIERPKSARGLSVIDLDQDGRLEVWLAGVGVFEMQPGLSH